MALLRERNGLLRQGTLETGKITKSKSLEFSSTRMGISTRGCGRIINDMGKVLIGRALVGS